MAMPQRRSAAMRKLPTQDRAGRTIATIYEAAADILQREGEANFTTNRIAERAGVSIGTVYQYFPHKDAILLAIAEQEMTVILGRMQKVLLRAGTQTQEQTVRELLRIAIRSFSGRQRLRRAIVMARLRGDGLTKDHRVIQGALAALIAEVRKRGAIGDDGLVMRPLSETAMFVMFRAIGGAIRSAVLEESPLLETQAFEDELVRLTMGMLRSPAG